MSERNIPVLQSIEKHRDTKYLKTYTLHYTNPVGKDKAYETVSNYTWDCPEDIGRIASGVVIIGFCGEKLLLLKEFRMGVNQFLCNLPAGRLEEGEAVEECARRELYEETGLSLKSVMQILPPSYASPDLSDSCSWMVIGEVEGELEPHPDDDEYLLPFFASREELESLLKTEKFSVRAQLAAWMFARMGKVDHQKQ